MFPYRDIFVTLVVFGFLPMALARPHVGILLWTWIGLMNPHKMTWSFAFNFPYAQIIGVVTLVGMLFSKEPKRLPMKAPVVMLILLLGWMAITTALFSLYPDLAWPKLWRVVKIQFFIFVTLIVMQQRDRLTALVLVATLSIAFFGIKGGLYTIAKGGGGMVLGPEGGFIAGNTEIALALVVTLPLMRWLQLQTDRIWLKQLTGVSMLLIAVSILGSYSRGGMLALVAVAVFLILKSRKRFVFGILLISAALAFFSFMPDRWHDRMDSIDNYQADTSAMGRIGAWTFAWNLAVDRPIGGGGFETFQPEVYAKYNPNVNFLDPHSIWFQILAEHGFVGLGLYILFWVATWRTGSAIIRMCRKRPEYQWARDLASMIQVALVGFWVGGSFLGLAYWDYPYILAIVLVGTRVAVERELNAQPARLSPTVKPVARPELQTG